VSPNRSNRIEYVLLAVILLAVAITITMAIVDPS
jgi:hypothetical protein